MILLSSNWVGIKDFYVDNDKIEVTTHIPTLTNNS